MTRFYPLGDTPNRTECEALEVKRADIVGALPSFEGGVTVKDTNLSIQAVYARCKRAPRKGEWYLSGARVAAYRAPNDLSTEYHIARLVVTQRRVTERIRIVAGC